MSWLVRMDIESEIVREERVTDSYSWHKKLWECFPGIPDRSRVEIGFLSRIDILDGSFRLWVMSKIEPLRPSWCPPDDFAINNISTTFLSHRYYAFDLKVNPVKTIVQRGLNGETLYRPNGKRKSGKRVPLVQPDELQAWLIRKGQIRSLDQSTGRDLPGGFQLVKDRPLEIRPMVESYFRKKKLTQEKDQIAFHGGVQFRGTLEVTDSDNFAETYHTGIGSAKGFGFGLLLLAPVSL